jgi:hypothetical protein
MNSQTKHSLIERMTGAARLDVHTFEEVEADTTATSQALIVVVLVALATGIAYLGIIGVGGLISGVLTAIVGWAIWAGIIYLIGTKLLPTPETHADWGQVARTMGFAQSPGVLKVLGFIPVIGGLIFIAVSLWQIVAMVIAVRQALDYTSTWRAVGVVLLGFVPYAIFMYTFVVLLG